MLKLKPTDCGGSDLFRNISQKFQLKIRPWGASHSKLFSFTNILCQFCLLSNVFFFNSRFKVALRSSNKDLLSKVTLLDFGIVPAIWTSLRTKSFAVTLRRLSEIWRPGTSAGCFINHLAINFLCSYPYQCSACRCFPPGVIKFLKAGYQAGFRKISLGGNESFGSSVSIHGTRLQKTVICYLNVIMSIAPIPRPARADMMNPFWLPLPFLAWLRLSKNSRKPS